MEIALIMGYLDEDLLSALVGERKADDDYPGKSDALTSEELEQQADAILAADESDDGDDEEEGDDELEQLTDLFRED